MKISKRPSKRVLVLMVIALGLLTLLQPWKEPVITANWQDHLAILPRAEFNGSSVTIRNVRNFRYGPEEKDMHPGYYDHTYNLDEVKQVWYIVEPFNENDVAAHTFVSFEFENGDFLAITIEARKTKNQAYSMWKGMLKTYPLVYIAADERDVVLLRANLRKDKVYAYPVKLEKKENGGLLLRDMLEMMNKLAEKPEWYHTLFANCTSSIAKHVNKLTPGRISPISWQLWFTASADELALKHGLLDTNLSIEKAREKYLITDKSQKIGDISGYSILIRK